MNGRVRWLLCDILLLQHVGSKGIGWLCPLRLCYELLQYETNVQETCKLTSRITNYICISCSVLERDVGGVTADIDSLSKELPQCGYAPTPEPRCQQNSSKERSLLTSASSKAYVWLHLLYGGGGKGKGSCVILVKVNNSLTHDLP